MSGETRVASIAGNRTGIARVAGGTLVWVTILSWRNLAQDARWELLAR